MSASRPGLARTDWELSLIVLVILLVGILMVYSASYGYAFMRGGDYEGKPMYFVKRQILFAAIGLLALFVTWRLDYHVYMRYVMLILWGTLVTLFIMAVVGRWILGGRTSVQPVEAAKIGAIIYLAIWLASKGDQIRQLNMALAPFIILVGFMAGLVAAQPDYSTALLLAAAATAMFYTCGATLKQMLLLIVVGGALLILVGIVAPYRIERIMAWRAGPFSDPQGATMQTTQSLAALTSGGILGIGPGQSAQKFGIYAAHTDYLYAVIGEEWGFVGAVFVILLYAFLIWRGLRIASYASDVYGRLLAVGIVSWIAFQAALHISVVTGSLPVTGTVLPMMSYGGSSLITCLASVGILLNISRESSDSRWGQDS